MLGWSVFAYRLADRGATPPTRTSAVADIIARWDAGGWGLDDMWEHESATDLGGDGYPCVFALPMSLLRARRSHGPNDPDGHLKKHPLMVANVATSSRCWDDDHSPISKGYLDVPRIDGDLFAAIPDGEKILIHAWDLS